MITVKKSEYNKAKLRKLFREASQQYIQITDAEAIELGLIEHVEPTGQTEPINPTGQTEPSINPVEDYFIYIGLNCPDENTDILMDLSINNEPLYNNFDSMGWRNIGNDISIYNSFNPAYNGGTNTIILDKDFNNVICYVAIPIEMGIYTRFGPQQGWIIKKENITIKGHQYNIYVNELEGEFAGLIYNL